MGKRGLGVDVREEADKRLNRGRGMRRGKLLGCTCEKRPTNVKCLSRGRGTGGATPRRSPGILDISPVPCANQDSSREPLLQAMAHAYQASASPATSGNHPVSGRPYLQSNKCHCCDAQQGVRGVEVRDGDGQLQAVALEGGGEAEDDAGGR